MTPKLFTELGLSPDSLKAVERLGFEQASPIQAGAIPVLLQGRDVVGQSQTGSGKTAAFGLPAIEKIDPKVRGVQVLVLCPTRELAVQVSEEIHKLAHFHRAVKPLPIFGGASYDRQYMGLRNGANIVIGTPGRVQDHIERGTLRLDNVRTVILDEADEMLDMGFREDIEKILQHVPADRQTVLFSATIPPPIEQLISRYTRNPERVQVAAKALTVPTVEQVYFEVHQQWKFEALTRLLDLHDVKLGIVFCNTQRAVDELTEHLHAAGYDSEALHGGLAQAARDRVMKKFKSGVLNLLVATDVAGRGIDVNDIEVVFNFDLPYDPEDYVHRIGRTGRAGRSGLAITLVSGREFFRIRHLERFINQRIKRGQIPSQDELAESKDRKLLDDVRTVIQHADLGRSEHIVQALMDEGFDSVQVAGAFLYLLRGGVVPAVEDGEEEERTSLWGDKPAAPSTPKAPAPVEPKTNAAPSEEAAAVTEPKPAKAKKRKNKAAEPTPAAAEVPEASPVAAEPVESVEAPTTTALEVAPPLTAAPILVPAPVEPAPTPAPEPVAEAPEPIVARSEPEPAKAREVEADDGFSDGENSFAPAPPVKPREAEPVRKFEPLPEPTASSEPGPVSEPPKFRASTWDRPKFAPRFSRPEPPAEAPPRRERPERPAPPTPPARPERPERLSRSDFAPSPEALRRDPRPRKDERPRDDKGPVRRYTARPDDAMTDVWVSVGEVDGITPRDIVGCILGETGLPGNTVGRVQIASRHTLVSVPHQDVRKVLVALNQAQLRGRRLRAKVAEY